MAYYLVKLAVTTVLSVAISEIAKKSSLIAAILASVPIISVLAMFWLYYDTKDIEKVSALSTSVFWLVLPSLILFVSLPFLLRQGVNFYLSITVSIGLTALCYLLVITIFNHLGFKL